MHAVYEVSSDWHLAVIEVFDNQPRFGGGVTKQTILTIQDQDA